MDFSRREMAIVSQFGRVDAEDRRWFSALGSALSLRLRAFAFLAFLASLAAGLTSGLAPALHARGDNLIN